jgi:V-type H+-transporting ATPase subunit a
MFGDIGHGMVLLLFALVLCIKHAEIASWKYLKAFLPHRYMLLLMGLFSLYCGFIYNEYLSVNLNFFGSCYQLAQVYAITNAARKAMPCPESLTASIPSGWIPYGVSLVTH